MKLDCTFREIAEVLRTTSSCTDIINTLFIDSRKPLRGEEVLFIAIKGPNNDGHKYVELLLNEGVSHFLVNENFDTTGLSANFIKVSDTFDSLQSLAGWHRSRFSYPVLAITGSAGKTSVKEWLYQLLKENYNIVRSPKSYNSQVGVPLSLFEMTENHDLAIIEAGISHPAEMVRLERMIKPTYGVLTNIGSSHAHNFETDFEHNKEKYVLFKDVEWMVDGAKDGFGIERVNIPEEFQMTDRASVQNAALCWAVLTRFDAGRLQSYKAGFADLEKLALRLEVQQGINNNIIVNDSYNSDLGGLEIALDLAANQPKGNLVLILSDIETDKASKPELYKKVAKITKDYKVSKVIGIGKDITLLQDHVPILKVFPSVADIDSTTLNEISNSCILLKGARKFRFETLGTILQEKHHDTVLEINLKALEHNLNVFRSKLNGVKIMCMVKAFGYGAGDLEIAKMMEQQGVEALGVAYADEGIALRMAGIKLPIMVMNAEPAAFNGIIENRLEPVIYNERILDEFIRELINYGQSGYPIHVELETGMNRLGVLYNELPDLCSQISAQPEVKVESVFSHLAVSENPSEDRFTRKQLERFRQGTELIEHMLGYTFDKHICNSAGILRFPEGHMDMVRLGIGVYGIDPTESKKYGLENVGKLRTTITQIRKFIDTETVGYGRSGAANMGERIGIIPIGYADGLKRSLSNGVGSVWVNGELAPIVGKVCMDMTMVNLSGIRCEEGDEVEVFGQNITVQDLAKKMETIPYEVLTSVSSRVKRMYIKE
jgi:Alr-MurF fusion protein